MAVPSEVAIFRKLEMDPTGRITSIVVEVFCIVGLCTARIGTQAAVVAILIFAVGVFFQLTELEIEWWGDGGLRFYLNVLGLAASIGLFFSKNFMSTKFYRKRKAS
jgi:Zn-dependent membrane protease YugP